MPDLKRLGSWRLPGVLSAHSRVSQSEPPRHFVRSEPQPQAGAGRLARSTRPLGHICNSGVSWTAVAARVRPTWRWSDCAVALRKAALLQSKISQADPRPAPVIEGSQVGCFNPLKVNFELTRCSMKPRLTVLLCAGSTMRLYPIGDPNTSGMPSTAELDGSGSLIGHPHQQLSNRLLVPITPP